MPSIIENNELYHLGKPGDKIFINAKDRCFNQDYAITPGLLKETYYSNNVYNKSMYRFIDALKRYSNYSLMPDLYDITDVFYAPQNASNKYWQRIRGWLLATSTGNYTFDSSCNGFCELYLSNDIDPKNKVLIINKTQGSSFTELLNQTSMVTLNINKKYYIEVVGEFYGFHELLYAVVTPGKGYSLKAVTTSMLSGIRIEKCISGCISPIYEKCIFENNSFGICTCKNGQKIINNQIVCQDGIESVQDSVFIMFEIPLLHNTTVATLKSLGKTYTVSFEVYPTSLDNDWRSVIRLTIGRNMDILGDRNPAVFFLHSTVQIASAINNKINNVFNFKDIPLKQWSSLKILQQFINHSYVFRIYINESNVYSVVNKMPLELSNVKVYAADPWHAAQSGFIRNLIIISNSLTYGIKVLVLQL